ncbi:DNA-directed RNA polymerase III subunit C37 KNAG_0C01490 [Huiozyma naganishii CBS 8797]|uniref:DNA-directed RNA polymerase III subunit RPC5 n=1 Tax=Huiozyma naganishii (strain ATCC MYA-139 / BCRC 22969 / CBS 8797 / KCTC 17520 / NBRC 10181 / NCYC 3082 / Yp74L-3) TaxID=1071383 RepID=J7RW91_HUIN7|nr:hypothetical protein KNAG_0C01490 [Kazachstania naganishii CBS 8797]CCK69262.1 hypothetical protein KNAG_0C01490 [Kazachstania naganishii CBS 8797]
MASNKLFVTEEEDEEDNISLEKVDQDGDITMREAGAGEATTEATAEAKPHKIGKSKHHRATIDSDEDDPVVEEFPINIAGNDEQLHVLQFASKPKVVGKKSAEHPIVADARFKTKSHIWELDIPLDEEAFFNKAKAEDNWNGVTFQTLKGVSVDNEGQYAAFVADKQLYLVPVKTISQMKPYFKYIDAVTQQNRKEESNRNPSAASQRAQVVTMSVKSVNDPSQNRLTGSLLAHKVADEEPARDMEWTEGTFEQFRDTILKDCSQHILKPVENEDKYLSKLL